LASEIPNAKTFAESLVSHAKVLELGPGNGQVSRLLYEYGLGVTTIEFSPPMAEVVKETAPHIQIIVDDFLSHDFGEEKYDGIIGIAFVHFFPAAEAQKVMHKIHSLLRSNGVAMLATTIHQQTHNEIISKTNFSTPLQSRRF
jgi:cyclopropane fatty-acyl-phospholipid synthase-like methyltransferase